ncbi:MAG TPA: Uma2 family endonuclease [Gemmatimonadaceae bacterium]|nr:Uma2 family endonuclease [Gemmatimonadaceae bacterium]
MAVHIRPWTRADLDRLPDDGNRYEVLDGQLLVTPQASHAHQNLALLLSVRLHAYVIPGGQAHVVAPGTVPFGPSELQPDVQVIPGPRTGDEWETAPKPLLVVEIVSDSTRQRDFGAKLAAYRDHLRVPEVWIVDGSRREVHVHAAGRNPVVERATLEWRIAGEARPLRIDLPALFREAGIQP